jgi:hypothetical protein
MDNFFLSEEHSFTCNEYRFTEHICYQSKETSGEWVLASQFPRHFNLFGFNDETHTLFFLGYYNGDPAAEERTLALDDFNSFLDEVYSEYYSFNK